MGRDDYARIVEGAGIVVDPFPFGGGVTTLEILHRCKVVVTCGECQSVPRLTEGMYRHVGVEGGVVGSEREVAERTVELMGDEVRRGEMERELCKRKGGLYDGKAQDMGEWEGWLEKVGRG